MKHIAVTFAICATLIVPILQVAAEPITPEQREAIFQLAQDGKKAFFAKDYETFVGLLHPEMVKAAGGKEKMIPLLKSEDDKNAAAGVVIESFDFGTTDSVHTGSQFTITFLTSTMIANIGGNRMQSKSFYVAFSPIGSNRWYLLDGTRLTRQQFQQLFRGLPADLALPSVERKKLE
jgi:hypothetical protein